MKSHRTGEYLGNQVSLEKESRCLFLSRNFCAIREQDKDTGGPGTLGEISKEGSGREEGVRVL